jgi:hypothetical protein
VPATGFVIFRAKITPAPSAVVRIVFAVRHAHVFWQAYVFPLSVLLVAGYLLLSRRSYLVKALMHPHDLHLVCFCLVFAEQEKIILYDFNYVNLLEHKNPNCQKKFPAIVADIKHVARIERPHCFGINIPTHSSLK